MFFLYFMQFRIFWKLASAFSNPIRFCKLACNKLRGLENIGRTPLTARTSVLSVVADAYSAFPNTNRFCNRIHWLVSHFFNFLGKAPCFHWLTSHFYRIRSCWKRSNYDSDSANLKSGQQCIQTYNNVQANSNNRSDNQKNWACFVET